MSKSVSPMLLVFLALVICVTLVLTRAPGLHQAPAFSSSVPFSSSHTFSTRPSAPKCSYDGDFSNDAPGCK